LKNIDIPTYTDRDLEGLRKSGKIVAQVMWEMINALRPGITPKQLDDIAGSLFKKLKSKSAPMLEGFPGNTCISVNEIIAHGVPDKRILKCGDRINIDVSAEHKGYFGDIAYTAIIGDAPDANHKLIECAREATLKAVKMSVHGTPINRIAKEIEEFARSHNYTIIKNLCSHGVGKSLHAFPQNILNYYDPEETLVLQEGMVIAWEPFVSAGACRAIETGENDWNLTTHNQSDVAQFEHTVLVIKGEPEILTLLE
jgi:methionyl aminopeptidase